MKVLSLFFALTSIAALNFFIACGDSSSSPPPPLPAPVNSIPASKLQDPVDVVRVIDGDTIEIRKGAELFRVRFQGVDTPELHPDPEGSPPEAFAEAARSFTLLNIGSQVDLEFDSSCDTSSNPFLTCVDQYDRLLAYIRSANGQDLCVKLLREGLATVYRRPRGDLPPFDRQATYLLMEAEAKSAARGIWSDP